MALTIPAGYKIYPHTYAMDEAYIDNTSTVYYPIGLYWESGIASNEVWWDATSKVNYPRVDPWTNATFFNNLTVGERDLTSYEENLVYNRSYIRCANSSVQYSGVELQLCYDWYDTDDDTSGTKVLTIWSSSYHPTTRINITSWKDAGNFASGWPARTRVYLKLVTNSNVAAVSSVYCVEDRIY